MYLIAKIVTLLHEKGHVVQLHVIRMCKEIFKPELNHSQA